MAELKMPPWNMDSAPKDRNILILCDILHYQSPGTCKTDGYRWVECWWDEENKIWQEWCGRKSIKSTQYIKARYWAELP